MELQQMIDIIQGKHGVFKPRVNPVIAVREQMRAPNHELPKRAGRSKHFAHGDARLDLGMFREHNEVRGMMVGGGFPQQIPRGTLSRILMDDTLIAGRGKIKPVEVDVQHYLQFARDNNINIPFERSTTDSRKNMADNIKYDKLPVFGQFHGIEVRDLAQMYFIVQQEGRHKTQALGELGWRSIGSGFYSNAFVHRDNQDIVVKVCWTGDNGRLWVKYAQANQGKAGVPVIHAIIRNGEGYMVIMERMLGNTSDEIHETSDFGFVEDSFNSDYSSHLEVLKKMRRDGWRMDEHSEGYWKELFAVTRGFQNWLPDSWRIDWHGGNGMISKSNGFVIIDPIT